MAINIIKEPTPIAAFPSKFIALLKVILSPHLPLILAFVNKFEKDYLVHRNTKGNKNLWFINQICKHQKNVFSQFFP